MTAKKVKASITVDNKPIEEKKTYQPVFKFPIVTKRIVKIDFNYFGIRQYLKNKFKLDTFKKLRDEKKKEESIIKKEKFDYKKYYEEMNQIILEWQEKIKKMVNK